MEKLKKPFNDVMNVNRNLLKISGLLICSLCTGYAGETLKWEQIPKAVQDTVLANGGTKGQDVDKEGAADSVGGKTTYEAPVKKNGKSVDLVITDDGKLVEIKGDNAADASTDKSEIAKKILDGVKFTHPRNINNP